MGKKIHTAPSTTYKSELLLGKSESPLNVTGTLVEKSYKPPCRND